MEVDLTPEQQAKLSQIAAYVGTNTQHVVMDAVSQLLERDDRFRAAVPEGRQQAAADLESIYSYLEEK